MRDYLEDWLSEEESVVVPDPAQSGRRPRRTKQTEEAEGGTSAGRTSGKQMENDGARMAWTENGGEERKAALAGDAVALSEETGALSIALAESRRKQAAQGALYAAMGKVGRVERLALGEERGQAVPLTLPVWSQGTDSVESLDRAVQRDARRYDSGFSLY